MAQLLLHGTNFVNFVGMHAWVGLEGGFEAVRVTEWDEPQAVIGSYLHRYAYPDFYRLHVERNNRELINWTRGQTFDRNFSGETAPYRGSSPMSSRARADAVRCLQMRGEYMFVAEGRGGFMVYDIAIIGNKGVSERIVTGPFSPLGHDTRVDVAQRDLHGAADQPADPARPQRRRWRTPQRPQPDGTTISLLEENQEQRFHPIYNYAVVTDSEEGLYLVNVDTMADGEPRNNFLAARLGRCNLEREWRAERRPPRHPGRPLTPISSPTAGLVVVDLDDPLQPAPGDDACR